MNDRIENIKKNFKLFSYLFLIFLILFVNIGPAFAISRGDYLEEHTNGNKKKSNYLEKLKLFMRRFHSKLTKLLYMLLWFIEVL